MKLEVREARSPEERYALYGFRYRIYVEEHGLSPAGADPVRRILEDALDQWSVSYALWNDDRVVGSLRLTYLCQVPDPAFLIERFAMMPAIDVFGAPALCTSSRFMIQAGYSRGKGVLALMERAYQDSAQRQVRLVYGDCSPRLLPFYEHLGYRAYASTFVDASYGLKIPLLLVGRDQHWLRKVRSPLARIARSHPDDPEARDWFARRYTVRTS
jgi:N-acyl-L-homoserine lactone synthetase